MKLLLMTASVFLTGANAESMYDRGLEALKAGDARSALYVADLHIAATPDDARFYYLRGRALAFDLGKDASQTQTLNNGALESYTKAIELDPRYGAAYAYRSGILANLGRYNEGLRDADLGLKYSSDVKDKAFAAYSKGYNLYGLNKTEEALAAYALAISINPNASRPHLGRGKVYHRLRMWKEAEAEFDKALKLNPELGAAWALRAEALCYLNHNEECMQSASLAVQHSPGDARSFRARAIAYQRSGNGVGMLEDATRVLEIDPQRPLAHLMRGKALEMLHRFPEALVEYTKEPDRKRAEAELERLMPVSFGGTRVDVCGDNRTTFDTPATGMTHSYIDECIKSINEALANGELSSGQAEAKPTTRPILGPPSRRRGKGQQRLQRGVSVERRDVYDH